VRAATPASVETIKAAEPLSTVLIGLLFMNEAYNAQTYISLVPICLGIGMACYNNDSFTIVGFGLAMCSNFCFSARAVYTKMLNSAHPRALSDIGLFHAISVTGMLFLFPVALLMEGSALWSQLYGHGALSSITGTVGGTSATVMLLLAVVNGATFAGYNLTSYVVLRRTELVTHSVLNVFRRVFIIAFTTVYFHAQLSALAMFGVLLATVGVLLFAVARRSEKKAPLVDVVKE
jgi:solute carrier family 35 protein E1